MLNSILSALVAASFLFIGYLLVRAYKPAWFGATVPARVVKPTPQIQEAFKAPPLTKVNTPPAPVPGPAPPVRQDPPQKARVVAAGGPNPPNAQAPVNRPATLSPEAAPLDPYEGQNMEAPIHDSMRHPELSFGPGVEAAGLNKLAMSGVSSMRAAASESPFSPEFAQNGGSFMGDVFANDLTKDDRFATA